MVNGHSRFSPKESAILNLLRRTQRPITTNKIAKRTKMSWHSADKTLKRLFKRGYLSRGKTRGGVTYWKL
ncbi:MAG: FaeA/PapI family transcriptional regulator [Candidatus Aenigmatarchaeota archaeon]